MVNRRILLPSLLLCTGLLSLLTPPAMAQDEPSSPTVAPDLEPVEPVTTTDTAPPVTPPPVEATPEPESPPAPETTPAKEDTKPTSPATQEHEEDDPSRVTMTRDVAGPYRSFRGGIIIADATDADDPRNRWTLTFGGYLRMSYRAIQDDPNIEFYGRNDGFLYANARPYFAGRLPSGLGFRFQFEAAASLGATSSVQPFEQQVMRPRDAFISYEPMPALGLQVGQFKPPHNLEELLPTADQLFVDRSVGGDGVDAFEGRPLSGMALPREIGAQLTGQMFFNSEGIDVHKGPGVAYGIAITNGSRASDTFNDNDALAYHGRASLHWGDIVSIGGAYYFNRTTILNTQDSIDKDLSGLTADIKLDVAGVQALASWQQLRDETRFLNDMNPAGDARTFTLSRAYMAQIGYTIPVVRLQPAYRFATYDPTVDYNDIDPQTMDIREIDALTYHTLALNYVPQNLPINVMLNYTIAQEQGSRAIANNNVSALMQLTW